MFAKIKDAIRTIRELIELAQAVNEAKVSAGPSIVEELEKLKGICKETENTADDLFIPLLDKAIKFFS